MARRSRKARPAAGQSGMRRGYARAEERNAAARATLSPLRPGERPPALRAAVTVAVVLAAVNLVALAAGVEVDGSRPSPYGVIAFAALMLVAAWGMWRRRYWAVLAFEALLGLIILFFSLLLLIASNLAALAVCVLVIGAGGWLFWKLIRVMGRIQAAERMG